MPRGSSLRTVCYGDPTFGELKTNCCNILACSLV